MAESTQRAVIVPDPHGGSDFWTTFQMDLDAQPVEYLRRKARELGMSGAGRMRRDVLVDAVRVRLFEVTGDDVWLARPPGIAASDLMDADEVAAHFGVAGSSLRVALTSPERNPGLARRLPPPLRRIGNAYVWRRSDVEAAT